MSLTKKEQIIYERARAGRETEREQFDAEAARQKAEADRQAKEYMAAYHRRLEERKAAQAAEQEAGMDRILEKDRHKHAWLAEHPECSAEDFHKKCWPHLRQVLMEHHRRASIEEQKRRLNYAL